VRGLPGSPERARKETELTFALGPVIQNVTGFGDPRVDELYGRIAELSHWLESDVEQFTFLAYGYAMNMVRADYQAARTMAKQLVDVASRSDSSSRRLLAYCSLGTTLFQLGEIPDAMPLIERAIELYDPARHERLITAAAIDPGVVVIGYRAWGEWHLGKTEAALGTMRMLLDLVGQHPHPFRNSTAEVWAAGLMQRLRDPAAVLRHAETALELATTHAYEELERYATILQGWAVATGGDASRGVEIIRRGLDLVPHGGSRAHFTWHHAMLAEAELLRGDAGAASAAIEAAKAFADDTGERVFEPELWRLEAEAGIASGAPPAEIDVALQRAIASARTLSMRAFELRATTTRFRVRGDDGSRADHERCCVSFSQDDRSADVLAARALLAEG
jgi:tetratricopeptide (TPR) repeat protein